MSGKGIRTLALLLLLILVALPLASCAGDGETPPADSQTGHSTHTQDQATSPAAFSTMKIRVSVVINPMAASSGIQSLWLL